MTTKPTLKRIASMLRSRWILGFLGMSIAIATFLIEINYGEQLEHEVHELYFLAVIASLIMASSFLSDALGIAPAIFEILFGFTAAYFGIKTNDTIGLLALAGSVFIMYVAGLEIDPPVLRRNLKKSLVAGTISFMAPMLVTGSVLHYLLDYPLQTSFLAALAVSTTGVAIVYSIIKMKGLLRRNIGQLIFATSMVADVAVVLIFTLLVSAKSLTMLLYFVLVVIFPILFGKLILYLPHSSAEAELRTILAVLIAAALVSELAGMHAILFAFLLGVTTRKFVAKRKHVEEKVLGLTFGFLAPIFFLNAGIAAMPGDIKGSIILAIILLAASYPAKVLLTHASLYVMAGFKKLRISSVFGARLTVSTVIAYTGKQIGVLSPELAGAIILSAIMATTLSAIISKSPVIEEP